MQVSKESDQKCGNRVNEKKLAKIVNFTIMYDGFSSFSIGLILTLMQIISKFQQNRIKNVDFIA